MLPELKEVCSLGTCRGRGSQGSLVEGRFGDDRNGLAVATTFQYSR